MALIFWRTFKTILFNFDWGVNGNSAENCKNNFSWYCKCIEIHRNMKFVWNGKKGKYNIYYALNCFFVYGYIEIKLTRNSVVFYGISEVPCRVDYEFGSLPLVSEIWHLINMAIKLVSNCLSLQNYDFITVLPIYQNWL